MKLHKFFSLKRFGHLLAADLRLNSKRYLYILAGAAVGIYLLLLLSMLSDKRDTVDTGYYFTMFIFSLLALGIYIGSAFPAFSEKTTTANFLLFPASNFEKLLSQFLLYYIVGIVLLILLFWIDANLARLSLLHLESVRTGKWIIEPFSYSNFIWSHEIRVITSAYSFTLIILSIAGFLFTMRLFFSRFALAKSIIIGVVLFMLIVWGLFTVPVYHGNLLVLWDSFFGIIFIFFLPLAYFKLKEKQL